MARHATACASTSAAGRAGPPEAPRSSPVGRLRAFCLEQPSPDHPPLVGFVREEPADDIAGDEALGGVALHVERGGAVALDVGRGHVAQAALPLLEVADAEVDPAG